MEYRAHTSGENSTGILRRLKQFQARLLVSRFLPYLSIDRNLPILDLGCGNGHVLFALKKMGYRNLIGIDQNPALSEDFKKTDIQYHSRDLESDLDLNGIYETIIMVNVIEHFLEPGKVLEACRKSLRPGGKVIVITPNAQAFSHKVFGSYWSGLHAPRHTHIFNPYNFCRVANDKKLFQIFLTTLSDPGSWAISFQNWLQSINEQKPSHSTGTAWYSIALLPIWQFMAAIEAISGRGASLLSVLSLNDLAIYRNIAA